MSSQIVYQYFSVEADGVLSPVAGPLSAAEQTFMVLIRQSRKQ